MINPMPVQKSEDVPVWDKPDPTKTEDTLSKKKKASAKARAARAGRPYPNLVDNMAVSKDDQVSFKISGKLHRIYEEKNGDIVVNHAGSKKQNGKYDKINLSDMAGVKSVKGGVKSTTNWHKEHPHTDVKKGLPSYIRNLKPWEPAPKGMGAKIEASIDGKEANNNWAMDYHKVLRKNKMNSAPYKKARTNKGAFESSFAGRRAAIYREERLSRVNKGLPSALRNPKFHPKTWANRDDFINKLRTANEKGKAASETFTNPYRAQATIARLHAGRQAKSSARESLNGGIEGVNALREKTYSRVVGGKLRTYKNKAEDIKAGKPSSFKESGVGKSMVSPGVYKPARLLSAAERKSVKSGKNYAASQGAAAQARDIKNRVIREAASQPGKEYGIKKPSLIRRAEIERGGYTKIKRNVYVKSSGNPEWLQSEAAKHAKMLPKMRRPTIVAATDKLPFGAAAAAANFGSKSSPRYILIPKSGVNSIVDPKRAMIHEAAHANTKRNFAGAARLKINSKGTVSENNKKVQMEEARADRYAAKRGGVPKMAYRTIAATSPVQRREYIAHTYKLWGKDNPTADKAVKIGASSALLGTAGYGAHKVSKSWEEVSKVFPQRAILTQGTRKMRVIVHYEHSPTHWGIIHPTEGQRVAQKDSIRFIPNKKPKSPGPDLFGEPLKKSMEYSIAMNQSRFGGASAVAKSLDDYWKKEQAKKEAAHRAQIKETHAISRNAFKQGVKGGLIIGVPTTAGLTYGAIKGKEKLSSKDVRKGAAIRKAEQQYDQMGNPVPARKPLMSGNAKLGAAGTAIGLAGAQRMASAGTLPSRLQGQSDAIASKVKFNERLANDQIQRVQNASQIRNPLTRNKQVRMHQYYSDKAQSTLADSRAKQVAADNALKAAPAKKLAHLKSGAGLVATGGVMGGLAVYNNAKDRKNKAQVK